MRKGLRRILKCLGRKNGITLIKSLKTHYKNKTFYLIRYNSLFLSRFLKS